MQTLQQKRAKFALEKVLGYENFPDKDKLKSRASELPFMIHANGLGQAAAFFKSKKGDGYPELYAILQAWLTQEGCPFSKHKDLMLAITQADMSTYCYAQAEAMQFMDWVKKLAKAYW